MSPRRKDRALLQTAKTLRWGLLLLVMSAILAFSAAPGSHAAPEPPDLSGSWAMIQFMPEIANLPLIGEARITAIVALQVVVEQASGNLTMRDTYCKTEVVSSSPVLSTEVPPRVLTSFDPPERTAQLVWRDGAWTLEQDWHIEVRGAVLSNPDGDSLPSRADDDRIIDCDGDGHPGFTVPVCVLGMIQGETHVVQRLRYRCIGTHVTTDRVEGRLDWTSEQVVVGASDDFLMTGFRQWHDPSSDVHRFFMVRLPEDATCADAVAILEETLVAQADP